MFSSRGGSPVYRREHGSNVADQIKSGAMGCLFFPEIGYHEGNFVLTR